MYNILRCAHAAPECVYSIMWNDNVEPLTFLLANKHDSGTIKKFHTRPTTNFIVSFPVGEGIRKVFRR